jgi:p38 MAP kinase
LKPSEILVNEYCDVKICDIAQPMTTPPVNTYSSSHYRAPEVTFAWKKMSYDMDIWSAGCIFAEMLDGRPIFKGTDSKYQFWNIVEVLGTPSADLKAILGNETAEIMESLPRRDKISFSQRFGNITAIGTLPNSSAALI